jgi:hypothetical protein
MKMIAQGGKSRRRGRGRSGRKYQNQNQQNENQNQFQFQGGQATDEYVAKVVGGTEQVGSSGPTTGAIVLKAQNGGSGGALVNLAPATFDAAPVSAPVVQKGGKKHGKKGKKGGNLLGQIAVPAVLLYANQAFGKRRSTMSKRSSRRSRRSRKFRR